MKYNTYMKKTPMTIVANPEGQSSPRMPYNSIATLTSPFSTVDHRLRKSCHATGENGRI